MRSSAVRLMVASVALGATASLFAQVTPTGNGNVMIWSPRDVTLLPGPYLLSGPNLKSPTPKPDLTKVDPRTAGEPEKVTLSQTPLPESAYSLRGAIKTMPGGGEGKFTVGATDRAATAEERLRRLRAERDAALQRKQELDAAIERIQSDETELARLQAELARLKREKKAAQTPPPDDPR